MATRNALAAIAREIRADCGGRSPPAENLHLTLAFLGAVDEHRLPELSALADSITAAPFALDLERIGYWRAQRLAWAAPRECPVELTALTVRLADALRHRGFRTEERAFKPHVTLLRDAGTPPALALCGALSIHWPVRQFVLASSEPAPKGVRYRVIGQWPVGGACL